MTCRFDSDALKRDLGRMSIEQAAPRHGMTSRTLARKLNRYPELRAAQTWRQTSKDRTGEQYGRWKIVRFSRIYREGRLRKTRSAWIAVCLDCGTEHEVRIPNLQLGRSSRCSSCAAKERERVKRVGSSEGARVFVG